jgi:hypothetical protein
MPCCLRDEDAGLRSTGRVQPEVDVPLCFAIMPITMPDDLLDRYGGDTQHFVRVAKHLFKPAAEAAGFDFRAPSSTSAEVIQAEIFENLEHADLVLCDMTSLNANVFFELGIRVALDRPVAMVRDNLTTRMPFDTSIINTQTYDCDMQVWSVEEQIPCLAEYLRQAATQTQNALWKHFGITQRAKEPDPGNPESAKLDLVLAEVNAIRRESRDLRDRIEIIPEIILGRPVRRDSHASTMADYIRVLARSQSLTHAESLLEIAFSEMKTPVWLERRGDRLQARAATNHFDVLSQLIKALPKKLQVRVDIEEDTTTPSD